MRRRIRYGRLYWLPLEADDIDKFFLVRIFRKLGIMYIPFTLRFYEELYLREDRSKYSRRLINSCRKLGIVTYVVQEGPITQSDRTHQARFCHIPLYADIFLCPKQDYEFWVSQGMPRQQIKIYDMQKFSKEDYSGVVLLGPLFTWSEGGLTKQQHNINVMKTIYDMLDKDVVFKPNGLNPELVIPFLPPHRVVKDDKEQLSKIYRDVYDFSKSQANESQDKAEIAQTFKRNYDGIAFLPAPVTWDDLGFTWRKDNYNVRVMISMYDMIGKNVMIKPHQGHKELIVPFLPPDRVVWDRAETLIKKYQKIYCFSDSSITKDCEMLGKQYEIVDKEEIRR